MSTNTRTALVIVAIVIAVIAVLFLGGIFLPPHTDFGPLPS